MGNELRRRSDRIERTMVLVLLVLFLVGAPLLTWWAARASYLSDVRAQEWEKHHVFRVEGVLVTEPEVLGAGDSRTVPARAARATWSAPDGTPRSGIVQVSPQARRGDRVPVWVDDRGVLRGPPPQRHPVGQALLIAGAVLLCLAALLAGCRAIGRALLDRQRARAWQREWREVGPQWSRSSGASDA
ncbi:hypothetical protein AB0F81_38760 [Actinoplanes sp. NPDC024001]|uniref:Rv1733c family protein n=1 Tax=Actinoplanes sp. NPDC024001 TaxID=3154598 RepID=UPI00340DA1F1